VIGIQYHFFLCNALVEVIEFLASAVLSCQPLVSTLLILFPSIAINMHHMLKFGNLHWIYKKRCITLYAVFWKFRIMINLSESWNAFQIFLMFLEYRFSQIRGNKFKIGDGSVWTPNCVQFYIRDYIFWWFQ
jgi:hypothetical protein